MKKDIEHPPINFGKTGVLIINLGTPDSTSWLDIRKYLKEFLSDRRVIEVNPIIWQVILNIFICLITCMVIMVIGNSIARAFALVGALSIIRFRTVIKDTKDIAYIFWSLVAGMATGTGSYFIAFTGTAILSLVAFIFDKFFPMLEVSDINFSSFCLFNSVIFDKVLIYSANSELFFFIKL